jgi:hypothetical protein
MNKFKVAHLREQGVDLIIIPLDKDFSRKPPSEQSDIADSLQACAMSAGLAGTVVPVWNAGGGRMASGLLKTFILISAVSVCSLY